jgi:hypothetical protein
MPNGSENVYIVKGAQVGRSAFNDQVVGRIAARPGAPVAMVGLVQIAPELVAINRDMRHITPGLAHGSRYVPDCTECRWIEHVDVAENRPRFALLVVFYGWMVAAEKQFFYGTQPPNLVYSFDHDAFFPHGPDWTIAHLEGASYPDVDEIIVAQCGLRHGELNRACQALSNMTPEIIAAAIAGTPDEWGGVTLEERVALAGYLWERCETMRE